MPSKRILLKTKHGSHLYGLATPHSDLDFYIVYEFPWKNYRPKKQMTQKIDDDADTTTASLDRFTDLCLKGVPQSLETLFSLPEYWVEYNDLWYDKSNIIKELVSSNISSILETYKRTALNFMQDDDFKKNRHALRLCHNAMDLKHHSKFNPTIEPNVREEITRIAALPRRQRGDTFKDIFFDAFGDL